MQFLRAVIDVVVTFLSFPCDIPNILSMAGRVGEMEKRICQALCKVKCEEDEAKEVSYEIHILFHPFF